MERGRQLAMLDVEELGTPAMPAAPSQCPMWIDRANGQKCRLWLGTDGPSQGGDFDGITKRHQCRGFQITDRTGSMPPAKERDR
jgi:hypothetical protein